MSLKYPYAVLKNSPHMKARMSYVRAKRRKPILGGEEFSPASAITQSLGFWKDYGTQWQQERQDQNQTIKQLQIIKRMRELRDQEKKMDDMVDLYFGLSGGAGPNTLGRDIMDGFLGPAGWAHMIARKKRDSEISNLMRNLGYTFNL